MEQKELTKINPLNSWSTVLILCATLGLAPFFPEPHIWGKIKWISGGAVGMRLMDWGDLLFHGFPWILAIRVGIIKIKKRVKVNRLDVMADLGFEKLKNLSGGIMRWPFETV